MPRLIVQPLPVEPLHAPPQNISPLTPPRLNVSPLIAPKLNVPLMSIPPLVNRPLTNPTLNNAFLHNPPLHNPPLEVPPLDMSPEGPFPVSRRHASRALRHLMSYEAWGRANAPVRTRWTSSSACRPLIAAPHRVNATGKDSPQKSKI